MQTLAGHKIRQYRSGRCPKMSRRAFASMVGGQSASTVEGWEDAGKRPRDPRIVTQIADLGIAKAEDWYAPAPVHIEA